MKDEGRTREEPEARQRQGKEAGHQAARKEAAQMLKLAENVLAVDEASQELNVTDHAPGQCPCTPKIY